MMELLGKIEITFIETRQVTRGKMILARNPRGQSVFPIFSKAFLSHFGDSEALTLHEGLKSFFLPLDHRLFEGRVFPLLQTKPKQQDQIPLKFLSGTRK